MMTPGIEEYAVVPPPALKLPIAVPVRIWPLEFDVHVAWAGGIPPPPTKLTGIAAELGVYPEPIVPEYGNVMPVIASGPVVYVACAVAKDVPLDMSALAHRFVASYGLNGVVNVP